MPLTLTQPVTVQDRIAGTLGDYNEPTYTWSTTWDGYWEVQQQQTTESLTDRDTISSEWRGFLPPDASVKATSRLVSLGVTYEVDGEPWQVWHPWDAVVDHIEVNLRVVSNAG